MTTKARTTISTLSRGRVIGRIHSAGENTGATMRLLTADAVEAAGDEGVGVLEDQRAAGTGGPGGCGGPGGILQFIFIFEQVAQAGLGGNLDRDVIFANRRTREDQWNKDF